MSGWFKLHRGWADSMDFAKEAFTEREAFLWLIENAAYEPHTRYVNGAAVPLERGQVLASQRTLGDIWKWGRQRVRGFIAKLERLGSITQNLTHGLTILTVCNYAKYQDDQPTDQPSGNPAATQRQPIKEEGKEGKEGKEGETADTASEYLFAGRVIKLNRENYRAWEAANPDLHLPSVLQSRDDWLAENGKTKNWFISTGNYLAKLQQAAFSKAKAGSESQGMPC